MGTVRFGNDHVAAILGFGDLQWGNILITRVYFVEGLGHNLFSVGQFCDSDLEVAFQRNACFVRNLEGVDLLKGDRSTNLYTINLHEMAFTSPICLMALRLLIEAARTMLIFSRAPLFLWAEAIATACFTQNRFIIHRRFNKTPYELINGRKPDISFLHVFGALCYPKNDREDIGKKIMETMNVSFDELSACMTSGQISSGLDLTYAPSTITKQQPTEGELDLLFEAMYDDYFGGQLSAYVENVSPAQEPQVRQTSMASTTIADNVPIPKGTKRN
nr:integrase, catalytic region, zinc finger, CCHC-type, peptidase aspartic, catalytic [Tanacetum cinerariifolium]